MQAGARASCQSVQYNVCGLYMNIFFYSLALMCDTGVHLCQQASNLSRKKQAPLVPRGLNRGLARSVFGQCDLNAALHLHAHRLRHLAKVVYATGLVYLPIES